jgi:enterochelin esterase-like enzyme
MDKRQDTVQILFKIIAYLIVFTLILPFSVACQKESDPVSVDLPAPTSTQIINSPLEVAAVTHTPTVQKPTFTPGVDPCWKGGTIYSGSFYSKKLRDDLHYQVYLPPCYHEYNEERYPVVYLLHGLYFTEEQWLRIGIAEQMDNLIVEKRVVPFLIVMPREARFKTPPDSDFPDAVVEELVPLVDQQYRTLPEKPYRAIGGLSRGAAWAVHIGFENPHLFNRVGAHSLALFEADGGKINQWLTEIPAHDLPQFFIDIGRSDPERISTQNFADQLDAHQIPHTWYLFIGGHTETYWSSHLELYLQWYAQDW